MPNSSLLQAFELMYAGYLHLLSGKALDRARSAHQLGDIPLNTLLLKYLLESEDVVIRNFKATTSHDLVGVANLVMESTPDVMICG